MYEIVFSNEFLHGPLWVYAADGIATTHFDLVLNDPVLKRLNKEAAGIFDSCYEFTDWSEPCIFHRERLVLQKNEMLSLISAMKERLNEINDGSFIVKEDYVSDYLMKL